MRFLSRRFNYDHAGRVTSGFGVGSGNQGLPFSQTYSYDAFGNMTGRSGSYYNYNFSAPISDSATYVNNRRTNWSYDAEGQVISTPLTATDRPRTMTYDAARRLVSSVETGEFNTITYAASYEGDGKMVYESSTTSPGTSESSYIVRSSVLGGEVLTRLDQSGNKKITHVPAEGLLFATQRASGGPGAYVQLTYRNPLGITETTKAIYDPLGNYTPFQASGDPRPPAGSYSSASMGGLSSSQANTGSYAVGCVMDGIPTNCKKVMEQIDRGQAKKLEVLGPALASSVTRLMMSLTPVGAKFVPSNAPKTPTRLDQPSTGYGYTSYIGAGDLWTQYILAPGLQQRFEQNPPQNTSPKEAPCSFNINITNSSGVPLNKANLAALEKSLNAIFATGGFRATVNNPNAASNVAFNYNLRIYNNFPDSYPQDARFDSRTIGYTRATRQIPDSPYPDIYFPGPMGGVSVNHIRASYGAASINPAALAFIIAGLGAHETIAHYLLMEAGHPEQYGTGITADGFDYRKNVNRFISPAVKEQLDKICSSGQLPK